jgi:hypothetical protein
LAAELKLPSWKGTVVAGIRPDGHVLIVAADGKWRRDKTIPSEYCGYPVVEEDPLGASFQ